MPAFVAQRPVASGIFETPILLTKTMDDNKICSIREVWWENMILNCFTPLEPVKMPQSNGRVAKSGGQDGSFHRLMSRIENETLETLQRKNQELASKYDELETKLKISEGLSQNLQAKNVVPAATDEELLASHAQILEGVKQILEYYQFTRVRKSLRSRHRDNEVMMTFYDELAQLPVESRESRAAGEMFGILCDRHLSVSQRWSSLHVEGTPMDKVKVELDGVRKAMDKEFGGKLPCTSLAENAKTRKLQDTT